MVEDCEEEVKLWFESLAAHVQRAYGGKHGKCTLKLPIIKSLAAEFGWGDMSLFQEMHDGFPLLGDIRPGLGWRLRNDSRYAEPKDIHVFLRENMNDFVQQKLRRGKVDECWQAMADEIAADVAMGRMEGPFEAPSWWCKRTVPWHRIRARQSFTRRRRVGLLAPSRSQCTRSGPMERTRSAAQRIGEALGQTILWEYLILPRTMESMPL